MIVMRCILGSEGKLLRNLSLQRPALGAIRRGVTRSFKLLHGENFVFGDLWKLNVLYLRDKGRALLIALDAVGWDEENRCSCCLNPKHGQVTDHGKVSRRRKLGEAHGMGF